MIDTINSLFEEGQSNFFDTIKSALYEYDNEIFQRLNFDDDYIYSEPMLFSYFSRSNPNITLDQILFGYYSNESKPKFFRVKSDSGGLIYLPNYGYLMTRFKNKELNIKYNEENIYLFNGNDEVSYEFLELIYLDSESNIEITSEIDLLSLKFFYEWRNVNKDDIDPYLKNHMIDLEHFRLIINDAFDILEKYLPLEYKRFLISTRKIILFANPKLRNFAIREAHGAIYLNVDTTSNVTFFLEEIVHQCSHTIFNAVTFNPKDFFKVDSNLPLSNFIPKDDNRSLYGAFHGIYTTGQIVELFLKLVKLKTSFDNETRYEIIGRLAINVNRINLGLEKIRIDKVFSELGKNIFYFLNSRLLDNIQNNSFYFKYKMDSHPVIFSYFKFKEDNPIEDYLQSIALEN